jgi:hypothetical protein
MPWKTKDQWFFLSESLVGQIVAFEHIDDGCSIIRFGPLELGYYSERERRLHLDRPRPGLASNEQPREQLPWFGSSRPPLALSTNPRPPEHRAMESAGLWKAAPKNRRAFPQPLENAPRPPPAFPTATTAPATRKRITRRETKTQGRPSRVLPMFPV